MSAQEAKEWGLIDEIIERRSEALVGTGARDE